MEWGASPLFGGDRVLGLRPGADFAVSTLRVTPDLREEQFHRHLNRAGDAALVLVGFPFTYGLPGVAPHAQALGQTLLSKAETLAGGA